MVSGFVDVVEECFVKNFAPGSVEDEMYRMWIRNAEIKQERKIEDIHIYLVFELLPGFNGNHLCKKAFTWL